MATITYAPSKTGMGVSIGMPMTENKSTRTKILVLEFDGLMFKCSKTAKRPLSLCAVNKNCEDLLFTGYQIFEFHLSETNHKSCKNCLLKNDCSGSNTKIKKASPKEANNG